MLVLGNKYIEYPLFSKISSITDVVNTPTNSIVIFDYDIELLKYCYDNDVKSAVKIQNITQAIFANSLNSIFLIVENNIAKDIQLVAQNYMFDSKIAQVILDESEIEKIALNEIDACIYKELL